MHGLEVCMTLDRETAPDRFSWCGRSRARILGRLAQAEMAQRAVDPQPRELLLHAVLPEPRAQNVEIDAIEILVLVEAGEHHTLDAAFRIAMDLQALRADLLHHALHRRVDGGDRLVPGLQVLRQHAFTRVLDRGSSYGRERRA